MAMLNLTETQRAMVVAGLAGTDVRTVKRHLRGKPVRPAMKERIELAARLLARLAGSPVSGAKG
jgi:hypothetical protein